MLLEQWQEISDRNAKAFHYINDTLAKIADKLDATPFWRIFKILSLYREFGQHKKISDVAYIGVRKHIDEWQINIDKRKKENKKELEEAKKNKESFEKELTERNCI